MEEKLPFYKTYRYEVSDTKSESETVIYALHGYGQLAKFFIRKFSKVFGDTLVVAPEGMHRFYLKGSSGRVGASWMTKESREDDIEDNIHWLNKLDRFITEKHQPKRKILLGFSQGGATAARWYHKGAVSFDGLILWACVFPPDLNPEEEIKNVSNQHFIIGTDDEYYQGESQEELVSFYQNKGYQIHQYEGKHDIDGDLIVKLLLQINPSTING